MQFDRKKKIYGKKEESEKCETQIKRRPPVRIDDETFLATARFSVVYSVYFQTPKKKKVPMLFGDERLQNVSVIIQAIYLSGSPGFPKSTFVSKYQVHENSSDVEISLNGISAHFYIFVVGFVRGVVTITGTDATWECVCGVVTQHDAVVSIAHGCQRREKKSVGN